MSTLPETSPNLEAKTLALYPGQGQKPMDLSDFDSSDFRDLIVAYEIVTGRRFSEIPGVRESRTKSGELLQPIFVLGSLLAVRQLEIATENIFDPDFAIGHSLGEYTALIQAGIWEPYAGLSIVQKRGEISDNISENQGGVNGMMAVRYGDDTDGSIIDRDLWDVLPEIFGVKVDQEQVNIKITDGVYLANHNGTDQVVISGSKDKFDAIAEKLKELGIICKTLEFIDGAFHSPQMEEGIAELAEHIETHKTMPQTTDTVIFSPTSGIKIETPEQAKISGSHILSRPVWLVETYDQLAAELRLSTAGILRAIELGMSKARSERPQQGVQTMLLNNYLIHSGFVNVKGSNIDTRTIRITEPDDTKSEAFREIF